MALAAVVVAGCYTGPGIDHFASVLDELVLPATWAVATTEVAGPDEEETCDPIVTVQCPRVTHVHVTEGDPSLLFEPGQVIEALHAAEGTVREAGFEIDREFLPEGDGQPSGPLCSFEASRDSDSILVTIDWAVHVVGLEDAPEGALAVRIMASRLLGG
jgi:hypothetical protein